MLNGFELYSRWMPLCKEFTSERKASGQIDSECIESNNDLIGSES